MIGDGFRLLFYCEHISGDTIQCKVYGRKFRFYNAICPIEDEDAVVDDKSGVFPTSQLDEMLAWRDETCSGYMPFAPWGTTQTFAHAGNAYSIQISHVDLQFDSAPEQKQMLYTGNAVPANIYPKGLYESENEPLEKLKVLKAALLLHNLTIVSTASGTLCLVNKSEVSNSLIPIADASVVEVKRKRLNRSRPDTSTLDCLLGDLANLKQQISDYYEVFFSQTWEIEVTIDGLSQYALALFDRLQIGGMLHRITELKRDPKRDEYKIKAWEL